MVNNISNINFGEQLLTEYPLILYTALTPDCDTHNLK